MDSLIAAVTTILMAILGAIGVINHKRAKTAEDELEKRKLNDLLDEAKKDAMDSSLSDLVDENNKRYGSSSKDNQ